MIYDLQFSDENIRSHKTLAEESMLGKLTKLASACPGSNVLERFYQRFCLFLAFHMEKNISSDVQEDSRWGSRLRPSRPTASALVKKRLMAYEPFEPSFPQRAGIFKRKNSCRMNMYSTTSLIRKEASKVRRCILWQQQCALSQTHNGWCIYLYLNMYAYMYPLN